MAMFTNPTLPISLINVRLSVFNEDSSGRSVRYSYCSNFAENKCSLAVYGHLATFYWEDLIDQFSDLKFSDLGDYALGSFLSECSLSSPLSVADLGSHPYNVVPFGTYGGDLPCCVSSVFDLYENNGLFSGPTNNRQSQLRMAQRSYNSGTLGPLFGVKASGGTSLPVLSFLFNKNTDFAVRLQRRSVRSPSSLLWSHRLTLFSAALSGAYTRRHSSQYLLASKTLIKILILKCFSKHERLFFNAPSWGWFGVSAFSHCASQSVDISWVGSIKSPRKRLRSIKRRFAKRVVSKLGTRIAFSGVVSRASSPSTRGI